ncbi:MAG: 50S ribosomal protein L25 [Deltaproteobacteria bacterium]|nr:50S ribosomal protein L25 [Deltaproteobacteria bacterium]
MAYETINLTSQAREKPTKSLNRALKRNGLIPAVFYGKNVKSNLHIAVSPFELSRILQQKGDNAIVTLQGLKEEKTALIRDVQRHPVTSRFLHADFVEVNLQEEIEVEIPLEFVGVPAGVKDEGGILQLAVRVATIKCKASEIPEKITVDVSALHMHDSIHVKELTEIFPNIKFVYDDNYTVISVVAPQKEKAPEPVAAPEGVEAQAEGKEGEAGKEAKGAEAKPKEGGEKKAEAGSDKSKGESKKE